MSPQAAKPFAVMEIDPVELAVRLCEAYIHATLDSMDEEMGDAWLMVAKAAVDYFTEVLKTCKRVH